MTNQDVVDELRAKILNLSERIWEGKVKWQDVETWLANFTGAALPQERERLIALYLLSQFLYFGSTEIRVLLRSLYRDLFLYPLIHQIRATNDNSLSFELIERQLGIEVAASRFLGIGNPSESGTHLLYFFRQENGLAKNFFIDTVGVLAFESREGGQLQPRLRNPAIRRYVFIDDICGSGSQACEYSAELLSLINRLDSDIEFHYLCLFATNSGLQKVRTETLFGDNAKSVFELDESYQCFSAQSRFFATPPAGVSVNDARRLASHYGNILCPKAPLGFGNCEMLLGFHHNTPDNTLPIIWWDEETGHNWTPVFKRYPKIYGGP